MLPAFLRHRLAWELFHPGPLGIFVNPFWLARRSLDRNVKPFAGRLHGRILDIGCGTQPYRGYFSAEEYVGLEIAGREHDAAVKPDVYYDGTTLPFETASFDCVVMFQVLEHVFEPLHLIKEIRRVLRADGQVLLTVPFVWDEHEQPHDFGRYTSFGLRHIFRTNGFEETAMARSCTAPAALFQLANAYLFKILWTKVGFLNALTTATLMAPVTCFGLLAQLLLPAHDDLYLDNVSLYRRTEKDE